MACPSLSVVQMVVLGVFVGLDVSAAEFSMFCRSEGGWQPFQQDHDMRIASRCFKHWLVVSRSEADCVGT